jgi:hypothetical protein
MIQKHLWGTVNALAFKATNAASESVHATVQRIDPTACGLRNRERFRNAILSSISAASISIPRRLQLPKRLPDAPLNPREHYAGKAAE